MPSASILAIDQGTTNTKAMLVERSGAPVFRASVPVAFSNEALPIGVQVIGRPFEDELVLEVAEAIESARGPWLAPPILQ